jgi:two-component system, NtrC family, sensor kinase
VIFAFPWSAGDLRAAGPDSALGPLPGEDAELNPDPVLRLDAAGTPTYANPAWCALAAAAGKKPHEAGRVLPRGVVEDLTALAAAGGARDLHDVSVAARSFTLRARAAASHAASSSVLVFFRETTEARRMRECLLQADRLSLIGHMAAGVGHEINNPAAFVQANLVELDRYVRTLGARIEAGGVGGDPAVEEALREIPSLLSESRAGIERIRRIVADLRSFARPDGDQEDRVDLHEVLDCAVALATASLGEHVRVERRYAPAAAVLGIARRLTQLFCNLLTNAVEAVAGRGTIRVSTSLRDGEVRVAIADDGCGIPEAVRARLFEPFVTTRSPSLGTGLGLYVCHNVVRQHGGEIEIKSAVGQGTTVQVRLPRHTIGGPS